jgi:hypothetical protein
MYIGKKSDSFFSKAFVPFIDHETGEQEIDYIHVPDEECASQFKVKAPKIIFFRTFDTIENVYRGKADLKSLQTFVSNLLHPTVYRFSQEWMYLTFDHAEPTVFLYRPKKDEDADYMKVYYEAAEQYKGKIFFTYLDDSSDLDHMVKVFLEIKDNEPADYKSLRAAKNNVIFYSPIDPEIITVDQVL